MNNNYFEHDENVQMAPPNYLGLRNQFFLFITFLKNSEHISVTFSAFTLLAILVINSFFSVYPLVPYIYGAVGEDPYDDYVLKLNSQSVFSTFLFYLCHVITDITIIIFFVCLYNPNLTIKLHWVLHPQVHIIVLPFISMVFSMCIFVFTNNDDDSFVLSFLSLSFLIISPIYLIIAFLLFCFDTNSIIKPNPIFAVWFYGDSIYVPILMSIHAIFCTLCAQISNLNKYALFSISIVLHIMFLIRIIYKMPFIVTIANQFIATNCFFVSIMNAFAIVVISTIKTKIEPWLLPMIPILYTIIFFVIFGISEYRRISMHKILQQFDPSVAEFTVNAIQITLNSYHSEHSIQLIIRDCFLSANKYVLSQRFLQYCLQLYPKSQWLLSTVTFLYCIVWSNNPALYKVMLHLLSVGDFNILPSFVIYQCVFSLQQSSKEEVSPMIKRDINEYRNALSLYADKHRQFWSSAADWNFEKFKKSISEVVYFRNSLNDRLHDLIKKYPFCPNVRLEASLYNSDIKHNFKESAKAFQTYTELIEGNESVARQLFRDFYNIFPISRPLSESLLENKRKNENSDLIFISFNETQEYASRYMLPPFKDSFYSLCQGFSIPKHKKPFEINFDRALLSVYRFLFGVSIIIYLILIGLYIAILNRLTQKTDLFQKRLYYLNRTLEFRKDTITCYMDSMIIYSYHMNHFEIETDESFRQFILQHLHKTFQGMLLYKYLINEDNILNDVDPTMPGCSTLNCTFPYIFGYMHNIANYYASNSHAFDVSPEYAPNTLLSSIILMVQSADNIYSQFAYHHCNSGENLYFFIRKYLLSFIPIQIVAFIIFLIFFELIALKLFKNLFAIINTVPSSVLKEIAHMFTKIETFVGHSSYGDKKHGYQGSRILFISSTILIFLYPITLFFVILFEKNNTYSFKMPPDAMIFLNNSITYTYIAAVHEFNLEQDYNKINGSKVQANFQKSCIHSMMDYPYDEELFPSIPVMNALSSRWTQTIGYILLFLSLFSFGGYILEMVSTIKMFTTMHQLMIYIPERAWKSNPVLRILTRGVLLQNDKVYEFRHDLLPSDFTNTLDLCSVKIANSGRLYDVKGNITKLIGFDPVESNKKLSDLMQKLIKRTPEFKGEIENYFNNRVNQPRSVTFDGKREVTISFSTKKNILFISDNSSHFNGNQILRKMQTIKYTAAFKSEQIEKPFICLIDKLKYKKIKPLLDGFEIKDRKNYITLIDREGNIPKQKSLIENIKNLIHNHDGKCVICNRGSLIVLGSKVMFPQSKGRIYGTCYEASKQILKFCKPGQIICPTSLLEYESLNTFSFDGPDFTIELTIC